MTTHDERLAKWNANSVINKAWYAMVEFTNAIGNGDIKGCDLSEEEIKNLGDMMHTMECFSADMTEDIDAIYEDYKNH